MAVLGATTEDASSTMHTDKPVVSGREKLRRLKRKKVDLDEMVVTKHEPEDTVSAVGELLSQLSQPLLF
jgi:hypothetical protein